MKIVFNRLGDVRHYDFVGTSLDALQLVVLSSIPDERPKPGGPIIESDQIAACRRGDRSALDVVFRAHAESLARLLKRMVGPSADVQDLLQDSFAEAIVAFPTFRGEASVKTWLHRIAIHVAYQHLRRPRHRREVLGETPELAADAIADRALELQQLGDRMYRLLDQLDPAKRVPLVLYVLEEYSIAEIAVLVGASQTAIKSRLFWARRRLIKLMRKDPAFANPRVGYARGERGDA